MKPEKPATTSNHIKLVSNNKVEKGDSMVGLADLLFLVVSAISFAALIAFVYACARL